MPSLDEGRLGDAEALAAADPRGMLRALATAGAQIREAIALSDEAGIADVNRGDRPRSVVVASLGGSAVVSDILGVLADGGSPVPVTVRHNAPLPGWVGPLDLVVAVSQSGRAAGPLALAAEAARRGCGLLTVGAPGSPLADVCAQGRGVHVPVATPHPTSRAALWSLVTPVLLAATRLDMVDAPSQTLETVADRLDAQAEACRPASDAFVNPAKVLALDIAEGVPVVLGDGPLMGVAARRAASMLLRTARFPATAGQLPDNAAETVSLLDGPFATGGSPLPASGERDIFADPFLDGPALPRLGVILLRDAAPEPMTVEAATAIRLADAVADAARTSGARVGELVADPGHPLERLAGQIALTDFAATYVALGLGLDPATSPHVADLRERTG
ncbi:MAG: phosphosugar isomerase [Micrococcales bacterium]|nr:phosphosugar isomerase [Micrococcales bacterium]